MRETEEHERKKAQTLVRPPSLSFSPWGLAHPPTILQWTERTAAEAEALLQCQLVQERERGRLWRLSNLHTFVCFFLISLLQPDVSSSLALPPWHLLPSSSLLAILHLQRGACRCSALRQWPMTMGASSRLRHLAAATLMRRVYLCVSVCSSFSKRGTGRE